ncbi:UDP-N-acetylglucosamine--dolichyl-phosphate N-acetylglucosaminephosphotransferase [Golovinomyces cichoracearum]|uniref:UDP-N-acetylglucosamine--dolichyl-phosphate N-acetylglucosaminephosphotransferase n=1 Tax=Golovinomyces cichoracearum TaxID=62708 RepID=A0A420H7R2_9PEZI|nr:UDP-N-acetylglucosamine--dolichyl-phosphate N-acetylglucosaminephosphotransferase [Golovinomyces cichoracearum]
MAEQTPANKCITSSSSSISSTLSFSESMSLTALMAASFVIIFHALHDDSEPLIASVAFSSIAFVATYAMIRWLGPNFIKAGLKGIDMSKSYKREIPETMGAICAVVYLLIIIIFIPFSFYKDFVAATSGDRNEYIIELDIVQTGRFLHRFPHRKLASYLSAILSLQSICILGIGDDLFDIRWRHKFFIPGVASIPILIVYFVDFGVTQIVVPVLLRPYLGKLLDLGIFYYIYMVAVAIFCPNSINILAGINGIEVSQSLIIAFLLILNDCFYLWIPYPHPATESHLFSVYMLLPFIGVSLALWFHNWYPSRVFVGDTYCYFAGMVFAVVGILGHFSKTLLLLFMPQIFNFIYSVPQLFHILPCPRHRLPRFNPRTGLMEFSKTEWQVPPKPFVAALLKLLHRAHLIQLNINPEGVIIESSNLTLLNLWLVWFGPQREDRLAMQILVFQSFLGLLGLFVRHSGSLLIFESNGSATRSICDLPVVSHSS